MLTVTIYPSDPEVEPDVIENIDFVSLVNPDTFGPPPLVAPNKDSPRPLAKVGERVLYINTSLVPLFEIERTSDP